MNLPDIIKLYSMRIASEEEGYIVKRIHYSKLREQPFVLISIEKKKRRILILNSNVNTKPGFMPKCPRQNLNFESRKIPGHGYKFVAIQLFLFRDLIIFECVIRPEAEDAF